MNEIKLTIEGEDISFRKVITEQRAAQIIGLLSAAQSSLAVPDISFSTPTNKPSARGGVGQGIAGLPIEATLEGFPGYFELSTKADKILWLLTYADQNGVTGLTSSDVDHLSSELKDRIQSKNFGVFNERNLRAGYIRKMNGRTFTIQKKGLDHLRALAK